MQITAEEGDLIMNEELTEQCPPGLKSIYKVVLGVITAVIITFLVWSSNCLVDHGNRLSVVETRFSYIQDNLMEVKQLAQEIRHDQIERTRKERGR